MFEPPKRSRAHFIGSIHRLVLKMQVHGNYTHSGEEQGHGNGGIGIPFRKMLRKDKRRLVERFCSIVIPENQNGKTRNMSITCNCCGKRFMGQLLTALVHLTGVAKGGQRMSACPTPNEDIKAEVTALFAADDYLDASGEEVNGQSFDRQYQRKRKASDKAQSAGKRNRTMGDHDDGPKTLAANPFSSTDMAILRFFSVAGIRPEMIESEAFVEFVRELRNAPKNYVLPMLIDAPTHQGIPIDTLAQQMSMTLMSPQDGTSQGGGGGESSSSGMDPNHPDDGNSSSLPVADFSLLHGEGQDEQHLVQDGGEESDSVGTAEGSRDTLPQIR